MFGATSIRYSLLTMVYYKVFVFHMSDDKIEYALQIGPMGASKKMVHAYLVLLMRLKVTTYIHEAHMSMRCEPPSEPA